MTRPLRIEFPDAIHHAMSRGLDGRDIFLTELDRRMFLLTLRSVVLRHGWRVMQYQLMPNHFHLLVQTPRANLGDGMRDLKGPYARGFNQRHGRKRGTLFETRYKAQLVQDDAHLLTVARYIALNPVRAGFVRRAEDWEWSSYPALLAADDPSFIDPRPFLDLLGSDDEAARREFAEVVRDGSGLPAYDGDAAVFGTREFINHRSPEERPDQPVAQKAWEQARVPLPVLVNTLPRDEAILRARVEFRYTLREIADELACSRETVRRRLKMWHVRT